MAEGGEAAGVIASAGALLLQREIPEEINTRVAQVLPAACLLPLPAAPAALPACGGTCSLPGRARRLHGGRRRGRLVFQTRLRAILHSQHSPHATDHRTRIPPATASAAALQAARAVGVPLVLLDAGGSSGDPLPPDLLRCLHVLSPNETELQGLTGACPGCPV